MRASVRGFERRQTHLWAPEKVAHIDDDGRPADLMVLAALMDARFSTTSTVVRVVNGSATMMAHFVEVMRKRSRRRVESSMSTIRIRTNSHRP